MKCIIFAAGMREMQFTAVVLTILMTGVLVFLLPGRVTDDRVTNRSRWLMASAFILTGLQFFLQFVLRLRELSVPMPCRLTCCYSHRARCCSRHVS